MAGIKEARDALVQERERTAASLRDLQGRLADIDSALKALDSLAGNGRGPRRGGRTTTARAGRRTTGGRAPREGTMAAAIEQYLAGQGRKAAHADEVLQALQQVEKAPSGKNPKASVEQTLRQLERRGRVRNVGRNRWRKVAA